VNTTEVNIQIQKEALTVIEFTRNTRERIRLELSEYQGNHYVDIRTYYEDEDGEYKPTKKGITFKPEKWSDFRKATSELEAELLETGLIGAEDLELTEAERDRTDKRDLPKTSP